MYKIYLAGGMGNLSFKEQNIWRKCIKNSLLPYMKQSQKVEVINPVDYYNFEKKEYKTQREIIEFDLHNVRTADLIIVNFNDKQSIGTAVELGVARENKIPIVGICTEDISNLHPWLVELCSRVCDSIDEAVIYVNKFYLS